MGINIIIAHIDLDVIKRNAAETVVLRSIQREKCVLQTVRDVTFVLVKTSFCRYDRDTHASGAQNSRQPGGYQN